MANIRAMTIEQFHDYCAPNAGCECDLCEMYREFDIWDDWAWNQGYASASEVTK
jgi:hypothetical protein